MGVGDAIFLCHKMYMAANIDDVWLFNRYMNDIKNVKLKHNIDLSLNDHWFMILFCVMEV